MVFCLGSWGTGGVFQTIFLRAVVFRLCKNLADMFPLFPTSSALPPVSTSFPFSSLLLSRKALRFFGPSISLTDILHSIVMHTAVLFSFVAA